MLLIEQSAGEALSPDLRGLKAAEFWEKVARVCRLLVHFSRACHGNWKPLRPAWSRDRNMIGGIRKDDMEPMSTPGSKVRPMSQTEGEALRSHRDSRRHALHDGMWPFGNGYRYMHTRMPASSLRASRGRDQKHDAQCVRRNAARQCSRKSMWRNITGVFSTEQGSPRRL